MALGDNLPEVLHPLTEAEHSILYSAEPNPLERSAHQYHRRIKGINVGSASRIAQLAAVGYKRALPPSLAGEPAVEVPYWVKLTVQEALTYLHPSTDLARAVDGYRAARGNMLATEAAKWFIEYLRFKLMESYGFTTLDFEPHKHPLAKYYIRDLDVEGSTMTQSKPMSDSEFAKAFKAFQDAGEDRPTEDYLTQVRQQEEAERQRAQAKAEAERRRQQEEIGRAREAQRQQREERIKNGHQEGDATADGMRSQSRISVSNHPLDMTVSNMIRFKAAMLGRQTKMRPKSDHVLATALRTTGSANKANHKTYFSSDERFWCKFYWAEGKPSPVTWHKTPEARLVRKPMGSSDADLEGLRLWVDDPDARPRPSLTMTYEDYEEPASTMPEVVKRDDGPSLFVEAGRRKSGNYIIAAMYVEKMRHGLVSSPDTFKKHLISNPHLFFWVNQGSVESAGTTDGNLVWLRIKCDHPFAKKYLNNVLISVEVPEQSSWLKGKPLTEEAFKDAVEKVKASSGVPGVFRHRKPLPEASVGARPYVPLAVNEDGTFAYRTPSGEKRTMSFDEAKKFAEAVGKPSPWDRQYMSQPAPIEKEEPPPKVESVINYAKARLTSKEEEILEKLSRASGKIPEGGSDE